MSKRIAIQLFGHLRTFEYTFKSFNKYLLNENMQDGYQIDIFIHTWDELDHSTINYRNLEGCALTDKLLTSESILLVNKLYSPKKILIESQIDCLDEIWIEKLVNFLVLKRCLNNSYTIYMVNKLSNKYKLENCVHYVWVIVTRSDILFKSPFSINNIISCYSEFGLEIPKHVVYHAVNPFGRGDLIEDPQFLAGSNLIFLANLKILINRPYYILNLVTIFLLKIFTVWKFGGQIFGRKKELLHKQLITGMVLILTLLKLRYSKMIS